MLSGRRRRVVRAQSSGGQDGQGLVEFALVGGLFFALLFSVMNAGFFLYGRNAVQHAADVGVAALAAYGNYQNSNTDNADTQSITRMDSAGLTTTPLIKVTEIDIWHELQSGTTFSDDTTGCGGGVCENRYSATGGLLNGVSGVPRWQPTSRNVTTTPDFARLVVQYKYSLLVANTTFSMSTSNVFRLEPQT